MWVGYYAEIDKGTHFTRIENGGGARIGTLPRTWFLCEDQGVLFIDPLKACIEPRSRFRWALKSRNADQATARRSEAGTGGLKAAWDDNVVGADLDALLCEQPAPNPDMAEIWRADPELWARLSEGRPGDIEPEHVRGYAAQSAAGYFRPPSLSRISSAYFFFLYLAEITSPPVRQADSIPFDGIGRISVANDPRVQ